MEPQNLTTSESQKIQKDLSFLVQQYLEVLQGLPEAEFIRAVSVGEKPAALEARSSQALGLYFCLLNMVEENAAAQQRRVLESSDLPSADGTFRALLRQMYSESVDPQNLLNATAQALVEPVLTAHPTEAKRTSILEHHRALYLCLVRLENQMWTPEERNLIVDEVRSIIEKIWKTGEIYHEKPSVQDELNNIFHYLQKVFPIVIPEVYIRLKNAWNWSKMPIPFPHDIDLLPTFKFGSWVGGDRDGHPLVKIEHTRNAFQRLRTGAIQLIHERLAQLASSFSMNADYAQPSKYFLLRLHDMEQERPRLGKPGEVWRHFLNQITARMNPESLGYTNHQQLLSDLKILRQALIQVGCTRLAEIEIDPVIQLVKTFPFTLARLDFRQNSAYQEKALVQILRSCPGNHAELFLNGTTADKLQFLEQELNSSRPFTRPSLCLNDEAKSMMDLYRLLHEEVELHQGITIGVMITSMTRSAADLFTVHLLMREADLWQSELAEDWNPFQVVPLFETIQDLQNAPEILTQYLSHPFVMRSLKRQAHTAGLQTPQQQVMIGYSDSNKDGGVVASFVSLYQTQKALLEIGQRFGVNIQFFHGRGGTISRGAGPNQRFLAALPTSALVGGIRVTEQGETISKKYANRITAIHHLECLLAGTIYGALKTNQSESIELEKLLIEIHHAGYTAYRQLVEQNEFGRFFRDISPIDVLEHSRIGSRPARRTGVAGIEDLRAIPWNFSWSQNRILLSGWYGFGSALNHLRSSQPQLWDWWKQKGMQTPLLRYFIGNVATVLNETNLDIADLYMELSTKPSEHGLLYTLIRNEYQLAIQLLQELTGQSLAEYQPNTTAILKRREHGLRILHQAQVSLLKQWRQQGSSGDSPYLQDLLLNVNAISAGLGHTG